MAFLVNCNARKCGKTNVKAELDVETQKVYCPECEGEITGISPFTVAQLKNLKQLKKPKRDAFGVSCVSCKHFALPLLVENQLVCPKCNQAHYSVPKAFARLVVEKIKQKAMEEKDNPPSK